MGGMCMKYYKIFGYVVKSAFEIQEAVEVEEQEWDVLVELGLPPTEVKEALQKGETCRVDRKIAWFYMRNIGMYYIEQGRHIIIWKESEQMTTLVRNYHLLGSAFSLLMFQREVIPMHSGTVEIAGKAVVLLGGSGAGKSTTSMLLRQQGGKFVSDDITPLKLKEGKVMVSPAFPVQRLCRDAALRQGIDLEELTYINPEKDKYAMFLKEGYCVNDMPLGMIVELTLTYGKELQFREVTGIEKLKLVYRNVFQGFMLDVMGITEKMHRTVYEVAQQIPVYQVIRPVEGYYSDQVVDWITTMLQNC